jgi:hypothetical protein
MYFQVATQAEDGPEEEVVVAGLEVEEVRFFLSNKFLCLLTLFVQITGHRFRSSKSLMKICIYIFLEILDFSKHKNSKWRLKSRWRRRLFFNLNFQE